jgi:hypothetical protein
MQKALKSKIPVWLRKSGGTENYVLGRIRKRAEKDDLEKNGKVAYADAFIDKTGDQIVKEVSGAVREQLIQAAEQAAIWVRRRDG